jgi:hypothetical protein
LDVLHWPLTRSGTQKLQSASSSTDPECSYNTRLFLPFLITDNFAFKTDIARWPSFLPNNKNESRTALRQLMLVLVGRDERILNLFLHELVILFAGNLFKIFLQKVNSIY